MLKKSLLTIGLLASSFFANAATFELSSPNIKPGSTLTEAYVFNGFGCSGKNTSPALAWKNAPEGTKSYAVTVYDPDAPTGSGWWHWVVYNIPAAATQIAEGAGTVDGANLPGGAMQGRTDFGTSSFGGACPPKGDKAHKYIFTVYALKIEKLEVPADATAALIGFMIHTNRLGEATFSAKYSR